MPASEAQDVRRGRLLHGLFWGGVGLAPLAVLILLFGQSLGALRVAVILAVLTIVLLAVSVAMRPSVDLIRVEIEERILDEVEQIRMHAREDVTTAARNTHRVLTEKIHQLTETVAALRAQIVEVQARPAPAVPAAPPLPGTGVPGVVHRTETVQVTRRTTTVDAAEDETRGTIYGSRAAVEGEWREHHDDRDPRHDRDPRDDRDDRRHDRGERLREGDWEATYRSPSRHAPAALPGSPGEPPSRYLDDGDDREAVRSRGRRRGRDDRDHHRTDHGRRDYDEYGPYGGRDYDRGGRGRRHHDDPHDGRHAGGERGWRDDDGRDYEGRDYDRRERYRDDGRGHRAPHPDRDYPDDRRDEEWYRRRDLDPERSHDRDWTDHYGPPRPRPPHSSEYDR
jgi:hypothetical protein